MKKIAIIAGIAFSTLAFSSGHASAQEQTPEVKKPNMVSIKKGDTLDSIAKDNDTTYPRLFDANDNIKTPDLIYAGEKIRIPEPSEKLAKRTVAVAKKPAKTTSYSPTKTAPARSSGANVDGGVWDRLAACESGGNWSINTGNGYSGGLQFSNATWRAVGGSGSASQASKSEQIMRGKILQQRSGWGQWPACSAKLGL